jgi:hypothetical protein
MSRFTDDSLTLSPLEGFVRQYVESVDGAWEEIEPQVYDLLIGQEMVEIAFDPEALPEHPEAQLASLGSPWVDRLLKDAADRWSAARFYRTGLNLHPHDVESRARRAISLPPEASLLIDRARVMNFPQAVFWFKSIFSSDQKEEEILPVGIDLHYLREVRQLDALLQSGRLSAEPEHLLAEVKHAGTAVGYRAAHRHAVRTVNSLANARRREWATRAERQIARMSAYYAQLRAEARELAAKPLEESAKADAGARAASRIQGIDREESLRIAELKQKSSVRVTMKLQSKMIVQQPKLLLTATVLGKDRPAGQIELVFDPLLDAVEAIACPGCGQPTYALWIERDGLHCENCQGSGVRSGRSR